jgi:serpin B
MRLKLLVIFVALTIAIGLVFYLVVQGFPKTKSTVVPDQAVPLHLAGQASMRDAVIVNNAFACDLYHQLAEVDDARNIFLSPYSIASALTLVAEGAQGETAEQLGSAMHYPTKLRVKGPEAGLLPWDIGHVNAGMAELNRELSGAHVSLPVDIRIKIDALRNKLAETNLRIQDLYKREKYEEYSILAAKAQANADELNRLLSKVDQYQLEVANTVWIEQTYPLNQNYVNKINKLYGPGTIFSADFINYPESMRQKINLKIEEQTHGQIKEMLSKGSVSALARIAIVNAIYFKGKWQEVFQKENTKYNNFFLLNGTKSTVPIMQERFASVGYAAFNGNGTFFDTPYKIAYAGIWNEKKLYPDKNGFIAIELPYKGEEISMIVVVPRSIGGFNSLEKKLTVKNVEKWVGSLKKREVEVYLPKFTVKTSYELKKPLQHLGIVRAFKDPRFTGGAELGTLSYSEDPEHRLFVTEVFHKTCLEVNEEGTVAAAVTYIEEAAASVPETISFIPVFRADKPFLFLIRHKKTNATLFIGRMAEPNNR